MQFDKTKNIALAFAKGGKETVVRVRFPADEEYTKRVRKTPQKMRGLHGGRTEALGRDVDADIDADLALFEAIRIEPETVPEDIALRVIEVLFSMDTRECSGSSGLYEVELEILQGAFGGDGGILTVHRLREPTVRQQRRYAAGSSTLRTLPGGSFQLTENPQAAEDLYDALFDSCEGYQPASAAGVPLAHKSAVISRMLSEIAGMAGAELKPGE